MHRKILEKIQFEYDSFVLDMTHTSRANIYANAKQILIKKNIHEAFGNMEGNRFSEEQYQLMLVEHNLLDCLYLKMSEMPMYLQFDDIVMQQLEAFVMDGKPRFD